MMTKHKSLSVALLFLLLYLVSPFSLNAGDPTDQIRTSVDQVLAILKNPRLKSEAGKKERRDELRKVVFARFDFTEMAKRSLGSHWRRRTSEEQEEFIRLFTDLLERAYLDRIEAYNDEKFVYLRENLDRNFAEVESRIVTGKGEEVPINYRVHLINGEWKVYDIIVENISFVNNYRSQFNRIITNSSYEELIRTMKGKQIQLDGEKK